MLGEKLSGIDASDLIKSYCESRGGREMLESSLRSIGRVEEGVRC